VAERARKGLVYLGELDRATRRRLKQQLLAPAWDLDTAGRRVVEKKAETKRKLGRSPDTADALNLAYLEYASYPLFTEADLRRAINPNVRSPFKGGRPPAASAH
jgi:hypothetical protein